MKDVKDLVDGFQRFRSRFFGSDKALFERLARQGQAPKVMVVACCDSRVDPAIITDCDPGDLFVVRNVANLVPPFEEGGGYHGTSAALEFAVRYLRVEHVIVMGHARCGGIAALMANPESGNGAWQFVAPWMSIATQARERVVATLPGASSDEQAAACERMAIGVSLRNLMTFPFVRSAVSAGELTLHGWYFDIERGELLSCDEAGRVMRLD